MPNLELLTAFLLATAVFAYMPGPSTLYAAAQTIALGRRGGLLAALGIHLGGYVHVVSAALGLAALFEWVPVLYVVLKFAGAAYLIWLGVRFFIDRQPLEMEAVDTSQTRTLYQSAMVEILNPKTAIFYVAFLPQFTDDGAFFAIWLQLLVLGTVVNVMFSSADLLCVLLAEKISALFKKSATANRTANRVGGGVLIALGINLAVSR